MTHAATHSTSSLEPKKPVTNRASLWAITAAHVTVDMHSGSLVVLLPMLLTTLHLNYANAVAIITVNQIVIAISQPLFGWLGDRQPDGTVIWLGCLIAGLGIAGVLWMPSYWAVMAAVMLSGLGAAMFHPEALSRARTLTGGGSTAVGVFFSGGNVGSALGPILATGLIGTFGKPGALLMPVPTALAMIGLGSQWRTIAVKRQKKVRETQTSSKRHHYPLIAFLIVLIAVRGTAVSGLVNFIPLYFGQNRQLDALSAAWLVTITSLAGVFGTLLGGSLADRFGRRLVMTLSILVEFAAIYGFLHLGGRATRDRCRYRRGESDGCLAGGRRADAGGHAEQSGTGHRAVARRGVRGVRVGHGGARFVGGSLEHRRCDDRLELVAAADARPDCVCARESRAGKASSALVRGAWIRLVESISALVTRK